MSRYRFPRPLLLRIALAVARGQPRSLGRDSALGLRGVSPPPLTLHTHYLPRAGPFVVVGNHYTRPGLAVWWSAMLVNEAVRATGHGQRELHWLMTTALLDVRLGPIQVPPDRVRAVLTRFARVYGFGLVPPRELGVVGGSAALRLAARYLAAGEPVGVLPEGTASQELREARPGVGTFLAWLTRGGTPLVPVGNAERDDVLTATIVPPFHLPRAGGDAGGSAGDKAARDRVLRDAVMLRIARLLPPELWGHYRAAMEGTQ